MEHMDVGGRWRKVALAELPLVAAVEGHLERRIKDIERGLSMRRHLLCPQS